MGTTGNMTQVAGRQNVNEPQPSNHLITSHYSNPMWRGTSRPGTCERATRGTGERITRDFLTRSSRPNLEGVTNAGVRTIIYDGNADYFVN
jgi:hypothetical protein